MKKLTILALHLSYGGCEKAIVSLVNSICDDFDIEILSLYKISKPAFKINKKVKIRYLTNRKPTRVELKKALKSFNIGKIYKETINNINVLFFIRKQKIIEAIKNCDSDIIISTKASISKKLGLYGSKKALKIGWEHNHHHGNEKYSNKVIESSKDLDYLILVSNDLKVYYKSKLKNCQCIYIPNSLDNYPKTLAKLSEHKLISIGRLSKEKGYADLIDVFKLVSKDNPDWTLEIFGDGSEKGRLQRKINRNKLNTKIILHGFKDKKTINESLENSAIYLMTSHTESFGIVLLEAMSYGLPCIAFDSAEGAKDLIENNQTGFLIKNRDKKEMADKINELINDYHKRIELGLNGYKMSLNYNENKVKELWIEVLERSK